MLNGIHFLLSYNCNFQCDHCFLYCSPNSRGTFTIDQVEHVLDEGVKMKTTEWIFFEGGEPFLYYPLLLESVRQANKREFKVGIVSNGYYGLSEKDAALNLAPLKKAGLTWLSISNDTFHYGNETKNPAVHTYHAAQKLGIDTAPITIEPPKVNEDTIDEDGKGRPVVGGGVKYRGRAVDKLAEGLPVRPWQEFTNCPWEDLEKPARVHVDAFGHVHICQGISIGNMWKTPLSELMTQYQVENHPICGPLFQGGPAELARQTGFQPVSGYIEECHLCYSCRKATTDKYPDILTPKQVYGL